MRPRMNNLEMKNAQVAGTTSAFKQHLSGDLNMSDSNVTPVSARNQPMMSSREIAELTNKEHKHVVRDIKALLEQLGFHSSEMDYHDFKDFFIKTKIYNGREVIDEILLGQDLSTTLVTGYSAQDRYKVVKRWRELETGKAQPLVAHQTTPAIQIDSGIIQLARVVAEATMKACLDATGHSTPQTAPCVQTQFSFDESEYVPVSKAAWTTGLSDSTCRKLIGFAKVQVRSNGNARGLLVNLSAMETAARKLLKESTSPKGNRKRWSHPRFGNFTYYADLI